MAESKHKKIVKVGNLNSDKPGVIFDVRLHNHPLFVRLEKEQALINKRIHFVMERLNGRNIPREIIKSCQQGVKDSISSATSVIANKVQKLKAIIEEKKIRITDRENHPTRVLTCTSNTRMFSEYVDLVDLADQAIWIIEGLSTARLIKAQQEDSHIAEIKKILSETETKINTEYSRILRIIKENGQVNEVAVAMPIDNSVVPELLDHPLIDIDGVQKVNHTLVVVDHPAKALSQAEGRQ